MTKTVKQLHRKPVTKVMSLRIPKSLYDDIVKQAQVEHRGVSNFINTVLINHIEFERLNK